MAAHRFPAPAAHPPLPSRRPRPGLACESFSSAPDLLALPFTPFTPLLCCVTAGNQASHLHSPLKRGSQHSLQESGEEET